MNPSELKIETLKPDPPGRQHVGKINTGVRVTHIPTGLVVECACERSQSRNRDAAMAMIAWGLCEMGYFEECHPVKK